MYFSHHSDVVPKQYFPELLKEIEERVVDNASERKSCLFYFHPLYLFNYPGLPSYEEYKVPNILNNIRTIVEKTTGQIFDYVLVHIYTSGKAKISWHFDTEALNSPIASVSLGASRKFRLKEKGRKKGWDHEIVLNSGDLLVMNKGCQQKYLHCVPAELKVKEPRINLTFRQYEI